MVEIEEQGYQAIRDFIESGNTENWEFIELRDENGEQVLRLEESSEDRVTWTHGAGDQVLELEVVVQGSDADISVPQTFGSSAIYDVGTGGDAYSVVSFDDFTIESDEDQLTVRHQIEVPEVL